MGYDIGVYDVNWLKRPEGVAYDYLPDMAAYFMAVGEGNAYGTLEKAAVVEHAPEWAEDNELDTEQRRELLAWVDSLPWDEDDCASLTINW